jgi:flagellar basal body-associated protein FliL
LKRTRRRRWWCIILVGLVVFIIALCLGVYIGLRGIGGHDDKDKHSAPGAEKKYRQPHSPPWDPAWTSSASPTNTVYIIVEEPDANPDAKPAEVPDDS